MIDNRIAYIREISYYSNCAEPVLDNPDGGSRILKFCIQFLKENKNRFNINKIQLKDNSALFCVMSNGEKKRMQLPLLSTLTYGHTWYGRYGFRPYDPDNDCLDKKNYIIYKKNQKIVNRTLTKNTKIFEYQKDGMIQKGIGIEDSKHFVDRLEKKYGNLTIMQFFQNKKFKKCAFLIHFYEKLAMDLGIKNFYGNSFYLEL